METAHLRPPAAPQFTVGNFPESVKIGDFNNDGLLDLVVANGNDNTVSILLGNGDGTFHGGQRLAVHPGIGAFPFFIGGCRLSTATAMPM